VGLAAQMQSGFADYVAGKAGATLTSVDMGSGLLQLQGADGSFGRELAAVGGVDFTTKVFRRICLRRRRAMTPVATASNRTAC